MTRVAMGDVWDDTKTFVAREVALLLPLALATFGLAWVIFALAFPAGVDPVALANSGAPLVMLPVLLLVLLGQLSVATLVVTPRASVAESLNGAARRMPGALVASLIGGLALMVVTTAVLVLASVVAMAAGGGTPQVMALAKVLLIPAALWLFVRLTPLIPLLAASPPTLRVMGPLRTALGLTRGQSTAIAGATLIFFIGYVLVVMATEFAGGTLLVLAGRAVSAPAGVATTLLAVLVAVVWAILQTVWMVFQAMLYRRLAR